MFRIEEINGGKRVYAEERIEKNTVICAFTGEPMYYEETTALGDKESFAFQVGKELYIYLDAPARYFNHCCEPNCGVTPELNLVALEDIPKNEELRWDYSTSMLEHHWHMKCKCHKPQCRKVIGDFTLLPKALQQKYILLNIVQPFILESLGLK